MPIDAVKILEYVVHVSMKSDISNIGILAGKEIIFKVFNIFHFYIIGIHYFIMFQQWQCLIPVTIYT